MNTILSKTLGGLDSQYYIRQFIFGLIFPTFYYLIYSNLGISTHLIILSTLNSLLYPYSRFVYERITSFIFGENIFIMNAIFLLSTKMISMYFCWALSILIAPVGLSYLYYIHTKNEAKEKIINEDSPHTQGLR